MHKQRSRHGFLVSAGWMALCYLIFGSIAEAATHRVKVGEFNTAHFEDADSGSTSALNPAVTVIRAGDTVQWDFFYQHSSTSGTCELQSPFLCTADGIWDSTRQDGPFSPTPTFSRQFDSVGVFPYFCLVHLATMRGVVIVLSAADYDLFGRSPSFEIGPMPTATIFSGGTATYSGTLDSYLGFSTPLSLTCNNGVPQNPTNCPTSPTTIIPVIGNGILGRKPFSFSVSETAGGDYTFDIAGSVAVAPSPFPHIKTVVLHVNDLSLTVPSPASITMVQGATAPQVDLTAQALGQFNANVNMSCNSVPAGIGCTFNQGSFAASPGAPQSLTATLTNTASVPVGNYTVNIVASSVNNLTTPATAFTRTRSVTLRIVKLHAMTTAPLTAAQGTPFSITVAIKDQDGITFPNYLGTVTFSSSGISASLPGNYTFNGTDNGVHVFSGAGGVTGNDVGPLVVTATDVSNANLRGSTGIIRVGVSSPGNTVAVTSSRTSANAYFRHANITFTAEITAGSTPTGLVRFYDGTTDIGTAPLTPVSGTKASASLQLDDFPVGVRLITAVYEPDSGSFNPNLSPTILQPRFPSPRCVLDVCPGSN